MTATTQVPHHMLALQNANRLRIEQARYRRELRAMQSVDAAAAVADVLDTHAADQESDALDLVSSDRVERFVTSIRRLGGGRYRRMALDAGLPRLAARADVRIRELTAHEAAALADAIRRLYPRIDASAVASPSGTEGDCK